MNFGVMGLTESVTRCIPTRALRCQLELLDFFSLNSSVKMGGKTKLLVKFPSIEVSNLLEYLIFGEVDCLLFPIPRLPRSSVGGEVLVLIVPMEILVPVLSLEAGVEVPLILL